MITWTLTAAEISSVFAANDTLTPGAIIAAGGAEDRAAAAAAEACEAILTHFAAHADTNRGGAVVTVRVADAEVIVGPGYTVDGRYDATGTTHGLHQVTVTLTGDSVDALLL